MGGARGGWRAPTCLPSFLLPSRIRGSTGHAPTRPPRESARALVRSHPESRYREVLAVSLARRPLFPGVLSPVTVDDPALVARLLELKAGGGQAYVGAFLRRDAGEVRGGEHGGDAPCRPTTLDDLHPAGTFAAVHTVAAHEGGAQLLLLGHRRLHATGTVATDPLSLAVAHVPDPPHDPDADELRATAMEIVATLKELLAAHPLYGEQLKSFSAAGGDWHDAGRLADVGASLTSAPAAELQAVLEEAAVPERAAAALLLLKKEVDLARLQADIGRRVEDKIGKDQRRYFLMEQLKSIKKELGLETDGKSALVAKFRARADAAGASLPPAAAAVIDEELAKLGTLEPASAEFGVARNYLDWLTSMPWGRTSAAAPDLARARAVLDSDHYGLDDVKDRVLEFVAVASLRGARAATGKILCLAGPPGVGKTSVGRSIAKALGREYRRFSVGGLADVAEVKGHRRTYVGAMPGKAVQALKAAGVADPLILIDEVDKLGRGHGGDPGSALLELLDPEQNAAFLDHYLDVPVDLSRVLFIATANSLDAIPGPLLDRMEVVRVPGYAAPDKIVIARRHLEPAARAGAGVPEGAVTITDGALATLVGDHCREAGVRALKNALEKIYRKAARKLVEGGAVELPTEGGEGEDGGGGASYGGPAVVVDEAALPAYVGAAPFSDDQLYTGADGAAPPPPGVAAGLAWTPLGGTTLFVEAALAARAPGKGRLVATGTLGDVMKESTTIAHTVARAFHGGLAAAGGAPVAGERPPRGGPSPHPAAAALAPKAAADASFFADAIVHVHVPSGATPKDGPSAGVTLVTSLLSLALATPCSPSLAMTGEVSLTGRLLPVGGIKEKVLAAKRARVARVALPEANRRDWDELGEDVKAGIVPSFHVAYDTVFEEAFGRGEEERGV